MCIVYMINQLSQLFSFQQFYNKVPIDLYIPRTSLLQFIVLPSTANFMVYYDTYTLLKIVVGTYTYLYK